MENSDSSPLICRQSEFINQALDSDDSFRNLFTQSSSNSSCECGQTKSESKSNSEGKQFDIISSESSVSEKSVDIVSSEPHVSEILVSDFHFSSLFDVNLHDFFNVLEDNKKIVETFQNIGFLASSSNCPNCAKKLTKLYKINRKDKQTTDFSAIKINASRIKIKYSYTLEHGLNVVIFRLKRSSSCSTIF